MFKGINFTNYVSYGFKDVSKRLQNMYLQLIRIIPFYCFIS